MALRNYLPEGCQYTPSDLVDRGGGTIVCDLNARELPAFPPHDVAVFSGVLEYINDVKYLLNHISKSVNIVIASYCVLEQVPGKLKRRSHGWVNDYTSQEFAAIFLQLGLGCDCAESWGRHKIYRFMRRGTGSPGPGATSS